MRNDCVDCLRGVGIFIIVWSHISLGILLDEIVNPIVLGVFFILSGMFYRSMPLYDLLRSKGKKAYLPLADFCSDGVCLSLVIFLCRFQAIRLSDVD